MVLFKGSTFDSMNLFKGTLKREMCFFFCRTEQVMCQGIDEGENRTPKATWGRKQSQWGLQIYAWIWPFFFEIGAVLCLGATHWRTLNSLSFSPLHVWPQQNFILPFLSAEGPLNNSLPALGKTPSLVNRNIQKVHVDFNPSTWPPKSNFMTITSTKMATMKQQQHKQQHTGCCVRIDTRKIFATKRSCARKGTFSNCKVWIGAHFYACIWPNFGGLLVRFWPNLWHGFNIKHRVWRFSVFFEWKIVRFW